MALTLRRLFRQRQQQLLDQLGDAPQLEPGEDYWREEREALGAALLPQVEQSVMAAVTAHSEGPAVALLLPAGTPALWAEVVIAREALSWAQQHVGSLIRDITDNTLALVRQSVGAFISAPGMTIGDLRDLLAPAFGEARAQRIAVTETTRAFAEGQRLVQEELRRGGLQLERVWRTSMDERVCPACGALEDRREGDGWDGYDGPPAHPNCRCWTVLAL